MAKSISLIPGHRNAIYLFAVEEFYGILQRNLKLKAELPGKPLKVMCQFLRKHVKETARQRHCGDWNLKENLISTQSPS